MFCKNTAFMLGGGLLAGYGALQIKGKNYTKTEVIGPIAIGLALLGYGFMNKGSCGKKPQPELPGVKESLEKRQSTSTTPPITLSRSSNAISSDARVWSNYTSYNTLNSSGNASPQYDYNHIYPGFI